MNVRYILNLKKNLLSLGDLKAQVCKFSSAEGGIKVTKSSMTILKGERIANLYNMEGIIIVGDASAAMENEDITKL